MSVTIKDPSQRATRRAYGLPELAESLGCSAAFLRLEGGRGKLRVTRLGRRVVVLAEDVEAYLAAGRDHG